MTANSCFVPVPILIVPPDIEDSSREDNKGCEQHSISKEYFCDQSGCSGKSPEEKKTSLKEELDSGCQENIRNGM